MNSECRTRSKRQGSGRALAVLLLLPCTFASASIPDSSVTSSAVIPDPSYAAGSFHRFLFGDLWREAWTTPVVLQALDVRSFAGGLTVLSTHDRDGAVGVQFAGADGMSYRFASLRRSVRDRFTAEMAELFEPSTLDDLGAMMHPYAPVMAAPLLDAAGIRHLHPKLVSAPRPGTLEVVPGLIELDPSAPGLLGTQEVLELISRSSRDRIDVRGYLAARLVDMYMGDWLQDGGSWRWVSVPGTDPFVRVWSPVSIDTRHAFSRFDGFIPWLSGFFVPRIESWRDGMPSARALLWPGRDLDRRILAPLDRAIWDSVTAVTASRMTDSVIERTISVLPPPLRATAGGEIAAVLVQRRALLPAMAGAAYRLLAGTVDVVGTDQPEVAVVERLNDDSVSIRITTRGGAEGGGTVLFARTFKRSETEEVRLHLNGGDDRVMVTGSTGSSITVRVIGGAGADTVVDASHVDGYWLSCVPFIADAETQTIVHDAPGTVVREGTGTRVHLADEESAGIRATSGGEDRGTSLDWGALLDWNTTLGPMVGLGPILTVYGYDADPFLSRLSVLGGVAPFAGVGKAVAQADWRGVVPGAAVTLDAIASGFETVAYFGRGNESDPALDPADPYYRVKQTHVRLEPAVRWPARGPLSVSIRSGLRYVITDRGRPRLVTDTAPYGTGPMLYSIIGAGVQWDSRDGVVHPRTGAFLDVSALHVPKAFTPGETFGRLRADLRFHMTAGDDHAATFSVRVIGEKVWGRVPYFELATIGSSTALRGYQQGRFAGTGSVVSVAEARVRLGRIDIITPVPFGVYGFVETGRVYDPGEDSRLWHPSWGGGIWAAPWKREATFTGSLGMSREGVIVYGAVGFGF